MNRSSIDDKRQLIYNLNKYLHKVIHVKFVGGKEVIGKLESFDSVQNLVLCNPSVKNHKWCYGEFLICLSHSIISIGLGMPQSARVMA